MPQNSLVVKNNSGLGAGGFGGNKDGQPLGGREDGQSFFVHSEYE
ncbi:hypothetical protein AB4X15_13445 [Peribacillus simplex]